jgi:hypothetical protein
MRIRSWRRGLVAAASLPLAFALAVPAALGSTGPTLLFNAQVNMTAPAPPAGMVDNFPPNKQNEPTIAIDPVSGVLVAGSNDEIDEPLCTGAGTAGSPGSCPFVNGVGNSGFYRSSDGGAHWTQPAYSGQCGQTIHTLPGYCQLGLESFGDPVLAVGPALKAGAFSWNNGSVVYYGNLAFPIGGAVPLYAVSRSPNDGTTWMSPVIVSSTTNPVDFNDKPAIAADGNAASPFFGNVYATWTLFEGAGKFGKSNTFSPEPIVVSRSTDGGHTWSRAVRLSQSANNGSVGGRQGSAVRTGPDGTVYVLWEGAIFHHSELLAAISHDGGATFSGPMPVAPVNDIPSPLPGSSFRNDSFPSVDVNQVTGAIDVVWADFAAASSTALIKFTESTNGGSAWSTPLTVGGRPGVANTFFPSVAVSPDGSHVFVGWPLQTWKPVGTAPGAGVVTQGAAFNVRVNGAWTGGQLLSTASGDPDGSSTNALGAQFLGDYATAVSTNSTGYFVWTDSRNSTPCAAVDAFRSGNGPKPNPDLQCPASGTGQLFGNSDIFVGAVGY